MSGRQRGAGRAILWAGFAAGVLDITYVFVVFGLRGASAIRILQGIAAGAIGREAAVAGGYGTAALGLAFHFLIAFGAATVFYAASRGWRVLIERPTIGGLLYGAAVWLFMNLVVLRLSATPPKVFPPPNWMPVLLAHLFCVGVPIAWIVRRLESRPDAASPA